MAWDGDIKDLNKSTLFTGINALELEKLRDIINLVYYPKGTDIIKENEIDVNIFIILEGQVEVAKNH